MQVADGEDSNHLCADGICSATFASKYAVPFLRHGILFTAQLCLKPFQI